MAEIKLSRMLGVGEDEDGAIARWGFGDRVRELVVTISDPDNGGDTHIIRRCYLDGSEVSPKGQTMGTCPSARREAATTSIRDGLSKRGYKEIG